MIDEETFVSPSSALNDIELQCTIGQKKKKKKIATNDVPILSATTFMLG